MSVSWNVKAPSYCTGIQYFLNGKSVPAAWSEWVLPSTTAAYHLTANMGNATAHLSSTTVIRTNVITYAGSHDAVAARTAAINLTRLMLGNLKEINRQRYAGWTIQLHIIPASRMLTDLCAYAEYRGQATDRATDGSRTYDTLRGAGGVKRTPKSVSTPCIGNKPTGIHMAVGEEQLINVPDRPLDWIQYGYTLVHEMGHTIQGPENEPDYALTSSQGQRVVDLYNARKKNSQAEWIGRFPDYTRESVEEYFSESVAAYFGYKGTTYAPYNAMYSQTWLQQNDLGMYNLLKEVFK